MTTEKRCRVCERGVIAGALGECHKSACPLFSRPEYERVNVKDCQGLISSDEALQWIQNVRDFQADGIDVSEVFSTGQSFDDWAADLATRALRKKHDTGFVIQLHNEDGLRLEIGIGHGDDLFSPKEACAYILKEIETYLDEEAGEFQY